VFEQFGSVQFVKYLREKGVAYVKFDRASSAALAIENLHEVTLNDGQGPRLKVLLADSPHTRTLTTLPPRPMHEELPSDPDNTPPRSRLFMVVPKSAEGSIIEAEMARFSGMQYCKTDLIATKGIVFVKYARSSSACLAMETIQETGMVAGYKVKVMLAEPKTRRGSGDAAYLGLAGRGTPGLPQGLLAGMGVPSPYAAAAANASLLTSLNPGLVNQGLGLPDYALLQGAVGASGSGSFQQAQAAAAAGLHAMGGMRSGSTPPLDLSATQVNLAGFGLGGLGNGVTSFSGMGSLGGSGMLTPPITPAGAPRGLGKTRLFVVVHKSVSDEALARVFRAFPGMEYCDLKKDRATGRSKGYAYVSYLAHEAAAAAQAQLNGIEFPVNSGYKLKVMYAEPLSARPMRPAGELLPGEEGGSGAGGSTGGYLPASGGAGSAEDNVAAAAAAAAVAGMAHTFMASPPEATCSTSMQLHTPMTGESTAGVLQSSGYSTVSGEPSPMSRGGNPRDPRSGVHSAHSSPLRPGMAAGLLDGADLAAVQNSLATMGLQENGHMHSPVHSASGGMVGPSLSDGATSSWRALSPDHLQQQQQQQQQQTQQQQQQSSPLGPPSAPLSPLQHAQAAAAQQAAAAAGSAGVSPIKGLAGLQGDETVVYSALSRPLPDYALTHVFSQVGPVEFVRVLADERVAMVKYCSPEGARLAVGSLNGTEVLGEVLHVRHSPPLPLHVRMTP
jgi:RNA recognition motif-containing protein